MAETTMTTISSPNTGDKYTHIHHKSGLRSWSARWKVQHHRGNVRHEVRLNQHPDSRPLPTRTTAPFRRAIATSWNTSCSRTRTATSLTCTPDRRKRQCVHLFRQDLLFLQLLRQLQGIPWRSCFPLSSPRTSRRKASPRNRASSAGDPDVRRRSGLACVLQYAVRSVPETPGTHRHRRHHREHCPDHRRSAVPLLPPPSTISTTWCWRLPETALWMTVLESGRPSAETLATTRNWRPFSRKRPWTSFVRRRWRLPQWDSRCSIWHQVPAPERHGQSCVQRCRRTSLC